MYALKNKLISNPDSVDVYTMGKQRKMWKKKNVETNKKKAITKRLRLTNHTQSKTIHILTWVNTENFKFVTITNKKYQQYE